MADVGLFPHTLNVRRSVRIENQRDLQEHLDRLSVTIRLLLVERFERIPKSSLTNELQGDTSHPFEDVQFPRSVVKLGFQDVIELGEPERRLRFLLPISTDKELRSLGA